MQQRIDTGLAPPRGFVAVAMELAMMPPAKRHGELVAGFSTKRPALGKAQVVGVTGSSSADQAGLLGDEADVVAVADAAGLRMDENRLIHGFSVRF
jgi:hypothetical protein